MKTENGTLKVLYPKPDDQFCPKCGLQMSTGPMARTKNFWHFILICDDCDVVISASESYNEN